MALATKSKVPVKRAKKPIARSTRTAPATKYMADGKTKLRAIKSIDVKYLGDEPSWENQDTWTTEDLNSRLGRAFNWYNYNCDGKDAREFFEDWCAITPGYEEYPKKFKPLADWHLGSTLGFRCRMFMAGLQIKDPEKDLAFINKRIAECEEMLTKLKPAKAEPSSTEVEAKKETIQDRLREKFSEVVGEIEGAIDEYFDSKKEFDTYKFLQASGLPAQFAAKIPEIYERHIAELEEYLEGKCPQLLEGYKHLGKRGAKDAIKFYQSIIDGANAYKTAKIATRAKPKRKPVSPEKLVRNLKYLKEFPALKLNSIDPRDIIGCTELWVYNTKTRKLGRFHANTHGDMVITSLGVKGSGITGFSESLSVCKTLRKPQEVIDKFKISGKPQLRKFLDSIKSVETKLKARISPETILLRAVK